MNHIFYKLANDAWIDAPDGGGYAGKIFSKEKFAELIVKECADFVDQNTLENQGMWGKIMRHFGVIEE